MGRPIEAVIFDWDLTLSYTRTANNTIGERLAHMFASADLPYSQSEIEGALEAYQREVAAGRLPLIVRPQRRKEIAQFYGYLFDFLGEEDKSWPVMERLYGTYSQLPTYLYEDSRPTLEMLGRHGFVLGIVSNHAASARPVIEDLLGDLVPSRHIVISEEIGVHKPAKTIFRHAAARVRTRPQNCIMIGDNLEVDAIGSVKAGGFREGVWLDRQGNGADHSLPKNTMRVTSLNELPPLLTELNA